MIALTYDNELGEADLARADDGGIGEGDELLTAILISLFTDALADDGEVPDGVDRRGWWGDAWPEAEGDQDRIGSRLWLLETTGRASADAPARARAYALEALQWMVTDGVARRVDATASRTGPASIELAVSVTLTDGTVRTYQIPV